MSDHTNPPAGAPSPWQPADSAAPAPWTTQWHNTSPLGLPSEPPATTGPATTPSERSRPGWRGTIGVGAAAAVLAALLTAGGMAAFDNNNSTATVPTSQSSSITSSSGSLSGAAAGSSSGVNWEAVSAAVQPSVVAVSVDDGNGSGDEGSGIVLDTQGHILTNNHVIADAATGNSANNASTASGSPITVTLSNGKVYDATVVGADSTTDLAVLKLTAPPSGLTPATFGDSGAVKVGENVMAIGNPLGLSDTVTTGIVSALNRPVSTAIESQQQQDPFSQSQGQQSAPVVTNAIQTDAAINPGNSGGALLDSSGHVIGVTSSIASLGSSDASGSQSGSIGLGFAIPSNEAKNVAEQLISTGTVKHAYLGVSVGDGTASISGAKQEAAIVGTVSSGTPAASAGLKDGDAIIALNGQPVGSADSLVGQVRALQPGTKVTLTVVRGGNTQNISLTLGTSPSSS
jgi:putative serine protease PepD